MRIQNKVFNLTLIISILFSYFIPVEIYATNDTTSFEMEGIVSEDSVRFRTEPDTSSNETIIEKLNKGAKIQIMEIVPADSNSGCGSVWYRAKYNDQKGYICSQFVENSYGRPWTTPKKSIIGGAVLISKSYIAAGQSTLYLQKFNVNPKSSYPVHNHQYMANLAAPASEAKIVYNNLSKLNFLDLPYKFLIPVFNDMPESTYNDNILDTGREKIEDVKDTEFENQISEFPDSYKPYLRHLHSKYPKWSFITLKTDLDFEDSVQIQKGVGSIQGTEHAESNMNKKDCSHTYISDGGYCRTEGKTWYIAKDEVVAFYLDPRNFLSKEYIFMFYDLSYDENQDEELIQNVLENSFMKEISKQDNQSYASIFVEAAKIAKVSALHLASRVLLEVSSQGSVATSGEEFTYKGYTYSNIYNFYNIGANSGEEVPVLAGLLWAAKSVNFLELLQLKKINNYVSGYNVKTTVSVIKNLVGDQAEIIIRSANNTIKTDSSFISTGDIIEIKNGSDSDQYTYAMFGDLNGDGQINSADLLRMRQHLLGINELTDVYLVASDLTGDGKIDSADLLRMRQHLLEVVKIRV
ncbi:MAG: hypothetical protein GX190_01945 [Mollicutes bacterium]|nr:hypothetical protein [Mollicutes bacterium]